MHWKLFSFVIGCCILLIKGWGDEWADFEDDCIQDYQGLVYSVMNRTSNIEAIRNAFYPPNEAESNVVIVQYFADCEEDKVSQCNETYIFQWMENNFLLPIDYSVLKVLTFGLANFNVKESTLVLTSRFCESFNIVGKLTTLTTWVSYIYVSIQKSLLQLLHILFMIQ